MGGIRMNGDSLKGKKAVFFDAGFTFLEPHAPVPAIYRETAAALGVDTDESRFQDAFHAAWRGAGGRAFRPDHRTSDAEELEAWRVLTRHIASEFPQLLDRHPEWLEALVARFDSGSTWRVTAGARPLFAALRERGLKLAVVSNWHTALHRILDELAISESFDLVVCSGGEGFRKPHPELFRRALSRLGLSPEEVVHIGDSFHDDVAGARRARIDAWHLAATPVAGRHGTIPSLEALHRSLLTNG